MTLPVYTVSSQDYLALKGISVCVFVVLYAHFPPLSGQVKEDPACFLDVKSTGIPALRRRAYDLTRPANDRIFTQYVKSVEQLVRAIELDLKSTSGISHEQREKLRRRWGVEVKRRYENDEYERTTELEHHLRTVSFQS